MLLLGSACAPLAYVQHTRASYDYHGRSPALRAAEQHLAAASKLPRDSVAALAQYQAAAQTAALELRAHPRDEEPLRIYNYALARSVEAIQKHKLRPWKKPVPLLSEEGGLSLTLTFKKPLPSGINPADYQLFAADSTKIGGRYFEKHVFVDGLGAAFIAVGKTDIADYRKTFSSKRVYASVTAVEHFNQHTAEIDLLEPLAISEVALGTHRYPLAADFSAPLAMMMAREHPEKLGLIRLFRPDRYANTARLTRLQPYDPQRIPVLFIHGLQDTPASWVPMINTLRADPEIRRRYQFWFFSYPSGYPYPYSAELLRRELDGINAAFPNHQRMVVVGHSMGGLIARLLVTDSGDKIWRAFFGKSPAETHFAGPSRDVLESTIIFKPRPEVSRVIFLSTPHRGSEIATNWIGRLASRFIQPPKFLADMRDSLISILTIDTSGLKMNHIPNSIDSLVPNNPFMTTVNKIPITPGVPYHSIIGDRGRGDTPNSSDGVVPYWSSHLAGAKSELIVPSDHGSQLNPKAIDEVHRILLLHLK
jgi:pimeloyl-ACP methyl ester carboxylesterase